MTLKDKAKKVGKAVIFMKLFEDIMANREQREEDFAKLKAHIEEWLAEAPDDLNAILASILVKAPDSSADEIKEEFEKAKAEYHAEDEDILPWFESQIDVITQEAEEAEAAGEEEDAEE